jgi:osmotically-inducible protein OsmY
VAASLPQTSPEGNVHAARQNTYFPGVTRPQSRTDANIAEALRRALEGDAEIRYERIEVAVSSGWVAQHGVVGCSREREHD